MVGIYHGVYANGKIYYRYRYTLIEERDADEVRYFQGKQSAPKKVNVFNPAFDVTPNKLITGIVTECGIIEKPSVKNIKERLG